MIIDVRAFPSFQRSMTSALYSENGDKIWPDGQVQGIDSQLVNEGTHSYITNESQVSNFKNVTRITAVAVQINVVSATDAVLDAEGIRKFRAPDRLCRIVYLKK